jgi:hypothetical protein
MEGFAYFPAIVYRDERPDLLDTIAKNFNKLLLENTHSPENNYIVQTSNLVNNVDLRAVADYILLSSVDILKSQGYVTDKYDFYIQGLWAQEIKKSGSTNIHVHKNSQISGWFFVETPVDGSYPIFYDTRLNKSMVELDFVYSNEITNAANTIHFNNIVPGTVIFGNSWMNHQLSYNNSELPTRCIHFIVSHRERMCSTC